MKKIFYVLLFMMLFIPFNAFATTATFTWDCPTNIAKGKTFNCTLKAKTATGDEATISTVTGSIAVDSNKFTIDSASLNKTGLTIGTTESIVGTVSISSKSAATIGAGDITISSLAGTDSDEADLSIATVSYTDATTILSDDTSISAIKVNGTTNTTCDKAATSCTLPAVSKNQIKLEITAATGSTVTGNATKDLTCGDNSFTFSIAAEDGTSRTYTIKVSRTCSTDVTLKSITISSGALNPTFSASNKSYTAEVASTVEKITIAAEKNVESQAITGTVTNRALQYGENKFSIIVTSESGAKQTYTVVVNRKDDRSENNYLSSLQVSEGKLSFNKETKEYTIRVLYDVTTVTATATPEDEKATVNITNNSPVLKVGTNNPIVITVTSENQKTNVYKVIVEKLAEGETLGDNPNIESIKIKGYDLGFSSNKTEYTLKLDDEDKLDIEVTMQEETATYEIEGNESLKDGSVITIKTTSADGTTNEYKIVIEKTNILLFIIIAGVTLLIAIALIVYLIVKKSKNSNKLKTNKLKEKLHQEELLSKVENQLNEQQVDLNTIIPERMAPITPEVTHIAPQSEVVLNQRVESPVPTNQEINIPTEQPKIEATRVCSICGHRVSASLASCPYCKRNF